LGTGEKRTHAAPQNPRLFDHLVGPDHQRQRHVDAELNERRHPGYFPVRALSLLKTAAKLLQAQRLAILSPTI
jgi:hypothetical protein